MFFCGQKYIGAYVSAMLHVHIKPRAFSAIRLKKLLPNLDT